MAVLITEIPDFRFSGLYYPQILQSLIVYRRTFMKDLSDEDPNEPTMQILGAFAAGFHYGNVLLDHVGLETFLKTSRLRESIKNHLSLIDYTLHEALAATATLLGLLPSPLTADTFIEEETLFATEGTVDQDEILFEVLEDLEVIRTDLPMYAFEEDGGVFTDIIDEINGFGTHQLWAGVAQFDDKLWIGHEACLWDSFRLTLSDKGDTFTNEDYYVWEYYDGETDDSVPSDVTNLGSELEFDLTNLLGTNRRSGAQVVVKYVVTGAQETATSQDVGGVNVVRTGFLGQATPSEEVTDYIVGTEYKEVPGAVLTEHDDGYQISFDLPESLTRQWQKSTVNGVEAFWLRVRNTGPSLTPIIDGGGDIAVGSQWIKFSVTQGETTLDDPAGIFDGTANQKFTTSQENVIHDSVTAFVDEGAGQIEYTIVEDFLSSPSTALHVAVDFDDDARVTVTYGDGVNGYLPPVGVEALIEFRTGAEDDGNVGTEEISIAKSGPAFISSVYNPRPAIGWAPPEASTDESIEEVKIKGPASLRLRGRALTLRDMEELAEAYIHSGGSQLISRAIAVADGFGDKTVKLIVVGKGGAFLTADQLVELGLAYNGDEVSGLPGYLVAGLHLTAVNYTRRFIAITAMVEGGDKTVIETALVAYLAPDAQRANGEHEHRFGGTVYEIDLLVALKTSDADIDKLVSMSVPSGDTVLTADELPYPDAIDVTVI